MNAFNGVAVDAKGDVVFSDVDNQAVRMVAAATGTSLGRAVKAGDIYTLAGTGPNDEGFKGNKKPATKAWLDTPQGVAVDSAGDLFISDSLNNMIRVVPAVKGSFDGFGVKAGDIYTIAGNGRPGYSGNGGPATGAALNGPAGLSMGPSGRPARSGQREQRLPRDRRHAAGASQPVGRQARLRAVRRVIAR